MGSPQKGQAYSGKNMGTGWITPLEKGQRSSPTEPVRWHQAASLVLSLVGRREYFPADFHRLGFFSFNGKCVGFSPVFPSMQIHGRRGNSASLFSTALPTRRAPWSLSRPTLPTFTRPDGIEKGEGSSVSFCKEKGPGQGLP